MSDKDKALFQEVREAVSNQGVQSEVQHAAMLNMFKQMEDRLHMQVRIEAAPLHEAARVPCKWACTILWALRSTADPPCWQRPRALPGLTCHSGACARRVCASCGAH